MLRTTAALAAAIFLTALPASAQRAYDVRSPDGATRLAVEVGEHVSYSVTHRDKPVLAASPISLTLEGGRVLGARERVRGVDRREVRDSVLPVAPTKSEVVHDRYNELVLRFGDHSLELRAYDEGIAYRWVLALGDSVTVSAEQASFAVAGEAEALVGIDTTFMTHYEPVYHRVRPDTLTGGR
ncbi:MAG TPA: glycoside hydrolase family 97 N-terminal domain-containing protein, partial [Gemmatimonadaceae bacterium]|nr:glycoside hydrolase family 97 N-terminal domain-containing protein [Gemmatimonadaceae bacterium]